MTFKQLEAWYVGVGAHPTMALWHSDDAPALSDAFFEAGLEVLGLLMMPTTGPNATEGAFRKAIGVWESCHEKFSFGRHVHQDEKVLSIWAGAE